MAKGNHPNTKKGLLRCAVLAVFLLAVVGFYIFRLASMQLSPPEGTVVIDGERVAVTKRTVTVRASRGEILDRNGTPLVKNRTRYELTLDAETFPKSDDTANELLAFLLTLFDEKDEMLRKTSAPVVEGYADGRYLYWLDTESLSAAGHDRYAAYLEMLGLEESTVTVTALLDAMFDRYHLRAAAQEDESENKGVLLYEKHTAYRIAMIRYDLETLKFDAQNPYVLCDNADISMITPVRERKLSGADFIARTERIYCYPGYASHILGRTGKIQASKVDYYTSLGYPLDAIVGVDGIEAVFEEQLRGRDGEMIIEEDAQGNILSQTVTKEAVAGRNIYLTLDIDLQIKAEDALAANIAHIVENALLSGEELNGEDANAGALVIMNPKNGEILASASYPTYDLTSYSEDFTALSQDENRPLFNRFLMGTYAPGSTFKVGVAACALEDGLITPETVIDTKGVYTFYEDYQPRCWLYTKTGLSHGPINVIQALCDSCNWFFFDVGRQLGIRKMADFMAKFGLGEKTGVELPEYTGSLSSPDYTDARNIPWTGAATLQTAIGQGYNAFTPMQLACYLSTVVNGGTRFAAHYYRGSSAAGAKNMTDRAKSEMLGRVSLSAVTVDTLKEAMRQVAEIGSAKRIFSGYGIPVGAKTGTAEGDAEASANGVFAAFAPLDNPEILGVSVIENGASGTSAGICVKDVFDFWFERK